MAPARKTISKELAMVEMAGVARDVMANFSPAAREMALAIGAFESGYGVPLSNFSNGQFWLKGNVPTYNWGAVNARSGMASVAGKDAVDGKPVTAHWAIFDTPHAGLRYFLTFWQRYPGAFAAANNGDVAGLATAMFDGGYYNPIADPALKTPEERQKRIDNYTSAIRGWMGNVQRALGAVKMTSATVPAVAESVYLQAPGSKGGSSAPGGGLAPILVGGGLVAALGLWALMKK